MSWIPKRLTREQMEERRRVGARLLKTGRLSYTAIARRLDVSGAAVGQWARQLARGGTRALRRQTSSGRPARLTDAQKQILRRKLERGALVAGFPSDRWTMGRVSQFIEREFGVRYHVKYVNRFLAALGWSLQQPLPRAAEQDEDLVQAWLAQDWPRIKKRHGGVA